MRYLILCLAALALGAPTPAAPSAAAQAEHTNPAPASYIFVPGDVIEITISSHEGYDRSLTIQPDGRIQFPLAGEITAAGLTSAQLAARIQEGLSRELVNPHVTVSLKELNRGLLRRVSVLGAVRGPGVFELKEKGTLAELLAAAGGPQPVADLSRITITNVDRSRVQTVDFSRAAQTGQAEGDVPLEPGDLIIVPTGGPATAVVMGEVGRPGSYEMQGNSRVMDAISQSGGPTPRADLARVKLTRAGQVRVLDLRALASGGAVSAAGALVPADSGANLPLQPGDMIVVPENEQRAYILGDVAKPDAYLLREGDHLLDLLTRAGGPTSEANPGKAMLIRRDERGQPVAQPLDLKGMLTKGDMRNNLALQQGDVILIPGKAVKNGQPSALTAIGALLSPITSLLYLLRF